MKKILNLDFCRLTYSLKDCYIDHEKELITEAYNINKSFFKIKIPKFEIQIVYSRKEFNSLWKAKTPSYVSAFAKDNKIVIFSYNAFEKETKWKKDKFREALIHEINHLFYQELRNDEYDPLWLSEGLATFMQHSKLNYLYKRKLNIKKEILTQPFEKMSLNSYQVFAQFVEFLILKFGNQKLFDFIKGLKKEKTQEDLFHKVYNKSFDNLIEYGNRYYQTT